MNKNSPIKICNETIHPGESLSLALPLPELFSCAPLYMPIKVIHGRSAGPTLLVTAAIHGNEINGTEIINRLCQQAALKRIHGTLIAIPVVNVYGLISGSRLLPTGADLDRCFPGNRTGTHGERLADLFTREIFNKADYCINLKTGFINYSNLPHLYTQLSDPNSQKLARVFNAPVISKLPLQNGMLAMLAKETHKPFLTYEAGEALRFDDAAIKTGTKGILAVMRELAMLPEKTARRTAEPQQHSFICEKNIWIRAERSGISHTKCQLGQLIKRGEPICTIEDPFGTTESITMRSPEDAIVVGKNNLPLVHEGQALFQLATFQRLEHTASHLGVWEQENHVVSDTSPAN